jgi:RimJ/RimL family protein N-acetyltransferase
MDDVRVTAPIQRDDEEELDAFLALHADRSMHLRAELRRGSARNNFAIARRQGRIVGGAVQLATGMIALQAPVAAGELTAAVLRTTRWRLGGFFGPEDQVLAACLHLGTEAVAMLDDAHEDVFALDLGELCLPAILQDKTVVCRLAGEADFDHLVQWRIAFRIAAMGDIDGPALEKTSRSDIRAQLPAGNLFILEAAGPLSCCSFNARLPDMVGIGNVWTPPELRGNGYARAVVAGALDIGKQSGVTAAVLATARENIAAKTAYRSIGFKLLGDYATFRRVASSTLPVF